MFYSPSNVLVLAPHTDDMELGCGGLVSRLILEFGSSVMCICFSAAEASVHESLSPDILRREAPLAVASLGISPHNYIIHNFPVRRFPEFRQDILELLISLRKSHAFDLVIAPSSYDIPQDHQTVYSEALRAFKSTTIIGYQLPWNCISSGNQLILEISKDHLDCKLASVLEFKSQIGRRYTDPPLITASAIYAGSLINVSYAEIYEAIRIVSRSASLL